MPRLIAERHDTLDAIGTELGVTRERVRQLEETALGKLKVAFQIDELVGPERSAQVLARLRGRPLRRYEATLFRLQTETERTESP